MNNQTNVISFLEKLEAKEKQKNRYKELSDEFKNTLSELINLIDTTSDKEELLHSIANTGVMEKLYRIRKEISLLQIETHPKDKKLIELQMNNSLKNMERILMKYKDTHTVLQ